MEFRELLRRSQTRTDLLFTMSKIPQARPLGSRMRSDVFADVCLAIRSERSLVSPSSLFELRRAHFASSSRVAAPRVAEGEAWWSQTGSNRRPHACKARALPAELWPRTRRRMLAGLPSRSSRQPARLRPIARLRRAQTRFTGSGATALARRASEGWWAWEDLNFRPHAYQARALTN